MKISADGRHGAPGGAFCVVSCAIFSNDNFIHKYFMAVFTVYLTDLMLFFTTTQIVFSGRVYYRVNFIF